MTDVFGYLEPCGCQSRPLGGVDKAASVLRELSADGVPSVLLTAGDLFFEPPSAGHGAGDAEAKTEHIWRAETLADALKSLGVAASEPGAADTRYGADTLAALDARAGAPLLSAQRATRLIERGGVRIGVWGLSDADGADLIGLAKQHTAALRASGAQVVIGLLRADARAARRVAGGVKGLDFVLLGGIASTNVPPPERVGQATLLQAGKHGHGLLVMDLFQKGEGAFADASTWTRAQASASHAARVAELAQRIAAWKRDKGTDPKLLAEQEQRLAALKAEHEKASASSAGGAGNVFSARFIELGPEIKGDAQLRALLDGYDKRINDHNKVALAGRKPIPVPKGMPSYVGSERCASCHEEAHAWWREHAHGHAYETLVKRNKEFNLSCVGCHVVGYGKPGGATVTHNEGLVDVGCESCHGPASAHIEDADADEALNVRREVSQATCVECHSPEHSDKFDYETYKAKLIVPGHGLPSAGAN